jgi:hypothetical protein
MVMANLGAAHAAEKLFRPIRASAVEAVQAHSNVELVSASPSLSIQAADGGKEFVKFVKFVRGYSIKWVGNFLGLLRQDRDSRPYIFSRISEAHRFNCFATKFS